MIKSVKQPLELKKKVLSPKQSRLSFYRRGEVGEQIATAFLKRKGYQILDTNALLQNKEIDIVALDPQFNEIVFVEVKTRRSDKYGHPSLAVGYKKLKNLNHAARSYCHLKHLAKPYRFDIISVLPGRVEQFKNVTWP